MKFNINNKAFQYYSKLAGNLINQLSEKSLLVVIVFFSIINSISAAEKSAEDLAVEQYLNKDPVEKEVTVNLTSDTSICEKVERWTKETLYFTVSPWDVPKSTGAVQKRSRQLILDENFIPYFGKSLDKFEYQEFNKLKGDVLTCLGKLPLILSPDKTALNYIFGVRNNENNQYILKTSRKEIESQKLLIPEIDQLTASDGSKKRLQELSLTVNASASRAPGKASEHLLKSFFAADTRINLPTESAALDKTTTPITSQSANSNQASAAKVRSLDYKRFEINRKLLSITQESDRSAWLEQDKQLKITIHNMLQELAERETADFRSFINNSKLTLDTLAQAVIRENKLKSTYEKLLFTPEFLAFNQLRAEYHLKILSNEKSSLIKSIAIKNTYTDVTQFYSKYVSDNNENSEPVKLIDQAVKNRLIQILPFANLGGGDYLNAIYSKDRVLFSKLNSSYISPIRDGYLQLLNGGNKDLMKEYQYYEKREKNGGDDFDKVPLNAVLITYIHNYQNTSKRCLRNEYMSVSETIVKPDLVTRNGYGIEIDRQPGGTFTNSYKINKEFANVFFNIGTMDIGKLIVSDKLLNKGKITELLLGTEVMMNKFGCDDPKIIRMEKNMLELYKSYKQ